MLDPTEAKNRRDTAGDYRFFLYEKYVSSEQAGAVDNLPLAYFTKLIREHLPANRDARILELGCGSGGFLFCCREAGYRRLRGIEISPEQVSLAHRRGLQDVVERGDLRVALAQAKEASCDLLLAFDVVEHLTKSEAVEFFALAFRTLAPGGRLILHVPNGDSPFVGSIRYGDFTHELAFTPKSMRQLALASGFASLACFEDAPIAHGLKSAARAVLWIVCRLMLIAMTAVETGYLNSRAVVSRNMLAIATKP